MNEKRLALVAGTVEARHIMNRYVSEFFAVIEAENTAEALEKLNNSAYSVSVIFIALIRGDGIRLIEALNRDGRIQRIPVIVFAAKADRKIEKYAYELGAAEFLTMPFDTDIIAAKLRNTMLLYRHKDALTEQSELFVRQSIENQQNTIDFLANVIEARSMENGEHVSRVKGFTRILAAQVAVDYPEYGLDENKVNLIAAASALHDLGKIMIRESILLKPGKLTDEEAEQMKAHTIYGCLLLNKMKNMLFEDFYETSYEICRSHHEKIDGSGYPDGLAGDEVPLSAQIVSIADCFDALTVKRAYKPAYPADEAYRMIMSGECGAFSERLLASFRRCKARFVNHMKQNALDL